jgi:hypothetical protein
MEKNKRVPVYISDEWLKALTALAGTFGVSAEQVIRRSLPDEAVIGLFFQCKDYVPGLRWDQVAEVGRAAIRECLRTQYRKGLEEHLARLSVSLESTAEEVEAARRRAFDEMRADPAHPLRDQLVRAEEDSLYLGVLYDAWKRAKAGQPGYAIVEVDSAGSTAVATAAGRKARPIWAVLKEDKVV